MQRKKFQKSEITMELSGWVQVYSELFLGKSSKNSSKPVLVFWSCIPYVFCLNIDKSCYLL